MGNRHPRLFHPLPYEVSPHDPLVSGGGPSPYRQLVTPARLGSSKRPEGPSLVVPQPFYILCGSTCICRQVQPTTLFSVD